MIKCHLCCKTAKLIEAKDPFFGTTYYHSPEGWQRGETYHGTVDFCSKEHKEYYEEDTMIGPPAIRLVFKIFQPRKDNGHQPWKI